MQDIFIRSIKMRIQANYCVSCPNYYQNKNKKFVSYTSFNALSPSGIERKLLEEKGIKANFNGNQLVADCINEAVEIYHGVLGNSFLPKKIKFLSFSNLYKGSNLETADGFFSPSDYAVNINSDKSYFSKNNFELLKANELMGYGWVFNDDFSTLHPLHTFIHEFAHCAHYRNLEQQGTVCNWGWLYNRKLTKSEYQDDGGRLGSYAQTDLLEYMAEVITKEILTQTSKMYPNGRLYNGKNYLESIKPDDSSTTHTVNTYNIWNGYKDRIESNLGKRTELSNKIDDALLEMHMLRW